MLRADYNLSIVIMIQVLGRPPILSERISKNRAVALEELLGLRQLSELIRLNM